MKVTTRGGERRNRGGNLRSGRGKRDANVTERRQTEGRQWRLSALLREGRISEKQQKILIATIRDTPKDAESPEYGKTTGAKLGQGGGTRYPKA